MKKFILTSATIFLLSLIAFGQDSVYNKNWYTAEYNPGPDYSQYMNFDVHGMYKRSVTMEKISRAKSLSDFIPGYPVNWVYNYQSVEIWATCSGKTMKAVSTNDVLSADQINILSKADLASEIVVTVNYKDKNPVTDKVYDNNVFVRLTVVPEVEAEFVGGYQKLIRYFRESILPKVADKNARPIQEGSVKFTIDEDGYVINSILSKTSGDKNTDKYILDLVNKMPKWKPAELRNGKKVRQEFEFSINSGGC